MNKLIKKFQPETEYFFEEGCHIVEISNSSDDEDVSIARARVEPGVCTKWHALTAIVERYFILEGSGLVEINNETPVKLRRGDVVVIPAGSRQRITNQGQSDLIFLAICSPRFNKANYNSLE